jgi:outer membrane lipoprotein-sorting protein
MFRFLLLLVLGFVAIADFASAKPAFSVTPYALSQSDRESLTRIEQYLTGVHTISAEFIQAAPSGDISTGDFYLQRPGKLRMEYRPPTPVTMVASHGDIVYYDKELDQVSHIPLESTQEKVRFDDSVIITGFERAHDTLRLSLVQAKRPRDGMLTLEFSDAPIVLHNMVVTDSGGQTTTVSLNNARFNAVLDSGLFVFHDPHPNRRNVVK